MKRVVRSMGWLATTTLLLLSVVACSDKANLTAVSSDGYVFEGHVPAHVIQRFLTDPPNNAIGLAVPGMPVGSPGMEVGDRFDPYDVLLLRTDGSSEVYIHMANVQSGLPGIGDSLIGGRP